jgi:hypothetical protein
VEGYSEAEYDVDFTEFLPISSSSMNGKLRGDVAELTYDITYTQASRVLHYLMGGVIKLDEKEQATADTAQAVFYEIITEGMSDYEKQLAIHDYLVQTVDYDDSRRPGSDVYTPYGALVNRLAVCQGYAEAARILLSMAGVENYTLTGTADGEDHMWNVVRLEGELYHMDVTWDSNMKIKGERIISHAYFNLTDQRIKWSHRWDADIREMLFAGECNATEFNYHSYNDLVVRSNAEYKELVTKKYRAGETDIEVYFEGMSIQDADIEGAARAAGASGYAGYPVPSANVLWLRFR